MTNEDQKIPANGGACASVASRDLFEDGVPLFKTDAEYQQFREEFSAHMEPILKEQRRARAESWMAVRDRIYTSNKLLGHSR